MPSQNPGVLPIANTCATTSRPSPAILSAGTGMDSHNGVEGVVFAGKKTFSFQAIDELTQRVKFAANVSVDVFTFAGQIEIGRNVVGATS